MWCWISGISPMDFAQQHHSGMVAAAGDPGIFSCGQEMKPSMPDTATSSPIRRLAVLILAAELAGRGTVARCPARLRQCYPSRRRCLAHRACFVARDRSHNAPRPAPPRMPRRHRPGAHRHRHRPLDLPGLPSASNALLPYLFFPVLTKPGC